MFLFAFIPISFFSLLILSRPFVFEGTKSRVNDDDGWKRRRVPEKFAILKFLFLASRAVFL